MREVAALYVDPRGIYAGLPGVDIWDEARDARRYPGPHPVVAHPPCTRWCKLAGVVESRYGQQRGADGGCFAAALGAVRRWGGVLEHPAVSAAWPAHDLPAPVRGGGWQADIDGAWTCYVEQGRYGHAARKGTWLYVYGVADPPAMRWGKGLVTSAKVGFCANQPGRDVRRLGSREASRTPPAFRDALLAIARSATLPA